MVVAWYRFKIPMDLKTKIEIKPRKLQNCHNFTIKQLVLSTKFDNNLMPNPVDIFKVCVLNGVTIVE